MNTYLIKIYCEDLDKKTYEYVIVCNEKDLDKMVQKEVDMWENRCNRKAKEVMVLMKIKDFR